MKQQYQGDNLKERNGKRMEDYYLSYKSPASWDGIRTRVLLVSPDAVFGSALVKVLDKIDVECEISRTPVMPEPSSVDYQEPTLLVIDADALAGDGDDLIETVASRQAGTPVVAFPNSRKHKLVEVTMRRRLVVYFTQKSPRLLIEGVLRLIVAGMHEASGWRRVRRGVLQRAHAHALQGSELTV
jgi:hypothetical protein